jgi:hypothetical protein
LDDIARVQHHPSDRTEDFPYIRLTMEAEPLFETLYFLTEVEALALNVTKFLKNSIWYEYITQHTDLIAYYEFFEIFFDILNA